MELMIAYLIVTQTLLIPVLFALYLGARAERQRKELLFKKALTTVRLLRNNYNARR